MKNLTSNLLTVSFGLALTTAVAGQHKTASSSSANLMATNYFMSVQFTNHPVVPLVALVSDIPVSDSFFSSFEAGYTDGSGKIEAVSDVGFAGLSLGPYTQGDVIANVTGSISTVKSNILVKMNIKGSGFLQDAAGANQAEATLSLTFKSTGPIVAMTNEFDSSTGPAIELTTNDDGSISSNFLSVVVQTNLTISPNFQELVFTVASSSILTNSATDVTISNSIDTANNAYPFGNAVSTNGQGTFSLHGVTFTNVALGYNITWDSSMTAAPMTNPIVGLDISEVPTFISNYFALETFTNSAHNRRSVQTVVSVDTNITAFGPNAASGGETNVTIVNNLSNSWYEIEGTFNGTLRAGHQSQSFKDVPATLGATHTVYSAFQGTGSNTTLQAQFGTDVGGVLVPTNDNGLWYVAQQQAPNDSLTVTPFTYFNTDVKQAGKNLWMSAPQGDSDISLGVGGSGSLNPTKNSYKITLTGVSYSSGATYKLSGDTGPLTVNFTVQGNAVTFTNPAAEANLDAVGLGDDTNFVAVPFSNFGTNNGLITTNFSFSSTNPIVVNGVTNNVINALNGVPVPAVIVTNIIPNGITTVVLSGKVHGQSIGPLSTTNASLPAPQ